MLLRLLLLAPLLAWGQPSPVAPWQQQYDKWYWLAPRAKVEAPQWSPDGRNLAYGWSAPTGITWQVVDCQTGQIRPAFDSPKLLAALTKLTGKKVTAKSWPFGRIVPSNEGQLRLEGDKVAWSLNKDGVLSPAEPSVRPNPPATNAQSRILNAGKESLTSPDQRHRVELRDGNAYLLETTPGREVALTSDGGKNALAYVAPVMWSPDGRHFALWREHKVVARRYTVINSLKGTREEIAYEKPGDERTERTPWVFSVTTGKGVGPNEKTLPKAYATERLDWSADSTVLRSEYIRRGFTGHGIIEFNTRDQAWRKLLAEEDPKFVYTFNTRYRYDLSDEATVWASERSGWRHLYAINLRTGQPSQPLTKGPWVVKEIVHMDAPSGQIYFKAVGRITGENPYHEHLCTVRLETGNVVDLTPSDGNHEFILSPDRRTLIDIASRVDQPARTTLRSAVDGRSLATLGVLDTKQLTQAGWLPDRPFIAKDRAGKFDIWGVVTRPFPFDPRKKYPVVENIYAGPHGSFTPRSFNWWNGTHRELASQGFYVVQMDGRGTNHRGKEFHQESWRNLKDGGFPDRIAWLQALAKVEPNLDLSRVGILGGSAGGQNTVHALLLFGNFYKAGAADCGCYDNRIDKLWWNEQWLGYPLGPWYDENSCARYAANLRGRLFLTVGESDTNVDVKCSYDLRDALLAAGKRELFEFHVIPGAGHGAGSSKEMREKRLRFFTNTLGAPLPR